MDEQTTTQSQTQETQIGAETTQVQSMGEPPVTTDNGSTEVRDATTEPATTQSENQEGEGLVQESQESAPQQLEVKYGEVEGKVELSPEHSAMLAEKGFNAQDLLNELTSEKGISEETYGKLVDAYGKLMVDISLKAMKADLVELKYSTLEQQRADLEFSHSLAGGKEKWDAMEAFATKLEQKDLDAFNEAMKSGSQYIQKLAIQDLQSRMEQAENGQPVLSLVDGTVTPVTTMKALSREEYIAGYTNGERAKDPAKWDKMRQLGLSQGI